MIGVSPTRPGRLYMVPPVELQAATWPLASTATAPMVPIFRRTLSAPSFSASACSSSQRVRCRSVISEEFATSGIPHSRERLGARAADRHVRRIVADPPRREDRVLQRLHAGHGAGPQCRAVHAARVQLHLALA